MKIECGQPLWGVRSDGHGLDETRLNRTLYTDKVEAMHAHANMLDSRAAGAVDALLDAKAKAAAARAAAWAEERARAAK